MFTGWKQPSFFVNSREHSKTAASGSLCRYRLSCFFFCFMVLTVKVVSDTQAISSFIICNNHSALCQQLTTTSLQTIKLLQSHCSDHFALLYKTMFIKKSQISRIISSSSNKSFLPSSLNILRFHCAGSISFFKAVYHDITLIKLNSLLIYFLLWKYHSRQQYLFWLKPRRNLWKAFIPKGLYRLFYATRLNRGWAIQAAGIGNSDRSIRRQTDLCFNIFHKCVRGFSRKNHIPVSIFALWRLKLAWRPTQTREVQHWACCICLCSN